MISQRAPFFIRRCSINSLCLTGSRSFWTLQSQTGELRFLGSCLSRYDICTEPWQRSWFLKSCSKDNTKITNHQSCFFMHRSAVGLIFVPGPGQLDCSKTSNLLESLWSALPLPRRFGWCLTRRSGLMLGVDGETGWLGRKAGLFWCYLPTASVILGWSYSEFKTYDDIWSFQKCDWRKHSIEAPTFVKACSRCWLVLRQGYTIGHMLLVLLIIGSKKLGGNPASRRGVMID